jgi:hypothetical protein
MVTDKDGYIQLIEYLAENLSLFENTPIKADTNASSIIEKIEEELSHQIMTVCLQNITLSGNHRNKIIREVNAILSDLEEVLSAVLNNPITTEQSDFIKEFSLLIKNLFDEQVSSLPIE